jgi:lipopolysaccharide/colanic/teichoic acid biosynthesis glycosyltransferase
MDSTGPGSDTPPDQKIPATQTGTYASIGNKRVREGDGGHRTNGHVTPTALSGSGNVAGAIALPHPGTLAEPAGVEYPFPREHGLIARGAKRIVDLVGSLLLIALLAPFLLMIAILIRADSPGPVLFRQRRIGRDGTPFSMLKFRTMVDGADSHKPALLHLNEAGDGLFKINGDPRTTRIGRWLRATSLDELPQLVHVVTGRMSLVGPRPLVPEEDALITGDYRRRLSMRPGMTGVWQVAGASSIPIDQMVELDRGYVEQWSLWLDCKLLLQTASHVVLRRGW